MAFLVALNSAIFITVWHDFTFQDDPYDPTMGEPIVDCLEYGWPWTFARRESGIGAPFRLVDFYPMALAANVLVAGVIAIGIGWLHERRCRRGVRWYQFGLAAPLVAMLLCGWGLHVFLQHRHAYQVIHGASPVVSLEIYSLKCFGPVALAGWPLPTRSKYAKPHFLVVGGYAIAANGPHPRPVIRDIVELDPNACRVGVPMTEFWHRTDFDDVLLDVPVQYVDCRFKPGGSFESLKTLPHLRRLWIKLPEAIEPSKLAALGQLPQLELLAITGPGTRELVDEDVEFLKSLSNLRVLAIGASKAKDTLLKNAAGMPRLRTLCLPGCPIDDEDLLRLSGLSELRRLELDSTKVSESACDQLKRSCPWLEIVFLSDPSS